MSPASTKTRPTPAFPETVWRRTHYPGKPGVKFVRSAFYGKRLAVYECIRNFFVGGAENSAEGLAGYVHFLCGLLLIQALQVG